MIRSVMNTCARVVESVKTMAESVRVCVQPAGSSYCRFSNGRNCSPGAAVATVGGTHCGVGVTIGVGVDVGTICGGVDHSGVGVACGSCRAGICVGGGAVVAVGSGAGWFWAGCGTEVAVG